MPGYTAMVRRQAIIGALLLAATIATPRAASAAQWHAWVGAQSHDKGHQALAFLPNEIWIHQGDSVTWTFNTDEIHTVTFLVPGQVRLPFVPPPCPINNPTSFNNTICVTTLPSTTGQAQTVLFPDPGNFKLVCLVHENMTGVVNVLPTGDALPQDQHFNDEQARKEAA